MKQEGVVTGRSAESLVMAMQIAMTERVLRETAKLIGVPVGKYKADTAASIARQAVKVEFRITYIQRIK